MKIKATLILLAILVSSFAGLFQVKEAHAVTYSYLGNKTGADNTLKATGVNNAAYGSSYTMPNYDAVTTTFHIKLDDSYSTWKGIKGVIWNNATGAVVGVSSEYVTTGALGNIWVSLPITANLEANTVYELGWIINGTMRVRATSEAKAQSEQSAGNNYLNPVAFVPTWVSAVRCLVYVEYVTAPIITVASAVNFYDGNNLYPGYYGVNPNEAYFDVYVYDVEGGNTIDKITIAVKQGATIRYMVNFTALTGAGAIAETVGADTYTYGSWGRGVVFGNASLYHLYIYSVPTNTASAETDLDLWVWAEDTSGTSDTETDADAFNVVDRIVTTGPSSDSPNIVLGTNLTVYGDLRYATSQTSNATSAAFPPTAYITSVTILDQYSTSWGVDSTVTNGVYSVTFNTTGATDPSQFYVYVNRVAPYSDGLTPDGRYVQVSVYNFIGTTVFGVIGDLLGISDITNPVLTALGDLVGSFALALVTAVDLITQIFRMITQFGGSLVYWLTHLIDWILTIYNAIDGAFSTAYTTVAPYAEIIDLLFSPEVLLFAAVIGFCSWYGGLAIRAKRQGSNMVSVLTGDVQVIMWWVDLAFSWTMAVFNFVWGIVTWFAGLIAGALT